jgi:hypothetical protein
MSGLQVEHSGRAKPSTISWEAFEGQRHPRVQAGSYSPTQRRRLAYAFRLSQTQTSVNSAEVPLLYSLTGGFDKLEEDHDRVFLKLPMPIGISSYGFCFRPQRHLPMWMSSWGTFCSNHWVNVAAEAMRRTYTTSIGVHCWHSGQTQSTRIALGRPLVLLL